MDDFKSILSLLSFLKEKRCQYCLPLCVARKKALETGKAMLVYSHINVWEDMTKFYLITLARR
jgi:hypothetical protein